MSSIGESSASSAATASSIVPPEARISSVFGDGQADTQRLADKVAEPSAQIRIREPRRARLRSPAGVRRV